MLIKRVTGISESLLTCFYTSGLKPALQCALLRSNPTTLDEALSLARAAEARFTNQQLWELLRSYPLTLGEAFFSACIIEDRFKDKNNQAVDTNVGDQEDLNVKDKQEVKKADDQEIENIKDEKGRCNIKIIKWGYVYKVNGKWCLLGELEIVCIKEKFKEEYGIPESREFSRHHLEDKVVVKEWGMIHPWSYLSQHTLEVVPYPDTTPNKVVSTGAKTLVAKIEETEASTFEELKHRLSTTSVLSLPDFNEVFFIEADASANVIGTESLEEPIAIHDWQLVLTAMQRRLWDPGIKSAFQDDTLRVRWFRRSKECYASV
ncbi:hypothetical protein Tco_0835481 [Tanacetum coccineum]